MNEKDLKDLKNLSVPPHAQEAKKKALAAAQHAFEAAGQEKQNNSQGSPDSRRLIDMQPIWRFIMKKQIIAGTVAASAVIVALSTTILTQNSPFSGLEQDKQVKTFANKKERSKIVGGKVDGKADAPALAITNRGRASGLREKIGNEGRVDRIGKLSSNDRLFAGDAPAPREEVKRANKPQSQIMAQVAEQEAVLRKAPAPTRNIVAKGKVAQEKFAGDYRMSADYDSNMGYSTKGNDKFDEKAPNPVKSVAAEPVSTFSTDVDTASYAFIRKSLNRGQLPQKAAVRIEEMINYFDYNYALPENAAAPFKATTAVYTTPWNEHTKLLHIGIKGYDVAPENKPSANLVFLIDVSGSMNSPDKLPLLKSAFKMMVDNMDENDTVSIVTYAGRAGTVLQPTSVSNKGEIIAALDRLQSGGSTAGAQGIRQAYALAERSFDDEGINRVILATDGDFNVGITDQSELKRYIEKKRDSGITLSVLGFGQGNYNDALMQTLAQNGNGNAAYIDTLSEARKVLVEEASSTLFTIAKDVKIQVEFNPNIVSEYRLVGYESRMLKREDFNNDKIDAGDIGSGHTVTAIYEIAPKGSSSQMIDDLRYGEKKKVIAPRSDNENLDEFAFLKMRYKLPNENKSKLITHPITLDIASDNIASESDDIRFAAAVAAFGQLLRGEASTSDFTYDDVIDLAKGARGEDEFGYRNEFIKLVHLAKSLK